MGSTTDRCLEGLLNEVFQPHINTENMSIDDVVEEISLMADINLLPDDIGRLKKKINRFKTQRKQRLFSWRL